MRRLVFLALLAVVGTPSFSQTYRLILLYNRLCGLENHDNNEETPLRHRT